MPTNLYGPGDNYHPENSHVVPALMRKFHEAKISNFPHVVAWGTGSPLREFLHVDDMASASVFLMNKDIDSYSSQVLPTMSHLNVGSGKEIYIKDLAELIASLVGFEGSIIWDSSKPDGTPRKLMNSKAINSLGWRSKIELSKGLESTYESFKQTFN